MDNFLRMRRIPDFFNVIVRVPPLFLMDMICNSKRCVSLDGWLMLAKLINFILHIPVYLKSNVLMNHLPLPDFEDATYFVWQTLALRTIGRVRLQKVNKCIYEGMYIAQFSLEPQDAETSRRYQNFGNDPRNPF
ncbi:UNVERIFIED_CONTAM: hypothetical protein NCL1_58001 [Trichonephila clavipes]